MSKLILALLWPPKKKVLTLCLGFRTTFLYISEKSGIKKGHTIKILWHSKTTSRNTKDYEKISLHNKWFE